MSDEVFKFMYEFADMYCVPTPRDCLVFRHKSGLAGFAGFETYYQAHKEYDPCKGRHPMYCIIIYTSGYSLVHPCSST